ncbi:MAG: hypothetical protein WA962_04305 [Ornithinimicrobium sp.]
MVAGATLVAGCGTIDATADPAAQTSAATASDAPAQDSANPVASEGDAAQVTTQAAPGGGDINDVVDVKPQRVLDEVEATDEVTVSKEVTVEIVDVSRTTVTARAPGEIGGPAVRVDVAMSNVTDDPVDLDAVTVTGADASETPLSPLGVDPADPFTGALEPGAEAQGTYLFSFPDGSSGPLTITVSPAPELPVAVFVGAL